MGIRCGLCALVVCVLFSFGIVCGGDAFAQRSAESFAEVEGFQIPPDEKPFWESAQTFVDAYAQRNAESIGELFTENAEFHDEFGERIEGRNAIVERFRALFESSEEAIIEEVLLERVRPIAETVVLEEGIVVASETSDGRRFRNRYVALHVKQDDGRWLINTLKDFPREGGQRQEELARLAWLVGEWVSEDSESVVHTQCAWSDDGNYLLRRFDVQTYDGRAMSGEQRIGWDPANQKLRSWTFDSAGGFFNGFWTQQDDGWILTMAGVNAEGAAATGTAAYVVIDAEMFTWQYRNLVVGDEVRGDGPVVTMVKQPPLPLVNAKSTGQNDATDTEATEQ